VVSGGIDLFVGIFPFPGYLQASVRRGENDLILWRGSYDTWTINCAQFGEYDLGWFDLNDGMTCQK
jgi:hypothetical protein